MQYKIETGGKSYNLENTMEIKGDAKDFLEHPLDKGENRWYCTVVIEKID